MVGSNDGTSGSDTRLDMSQPHARTRPHFSDPRLTPDAQDRLGRVLRYREERRLIPACTKANPFRTSSSDGRPIRPMHDPQCGLVLNRVRGVRVRAMRQNEASKRNGINTLNRESLMLNLALGTS